MRIRATRISSITLAVFLVILGGTTGWALLSVRSAVTEMASATDTLQAYALLQRAVAGEAYAEASYRRAPSPAARARIDTSIADVTSAGAAVRAVGGPKDRAVLSYVTLTNARYATELRTDLDHPTPRGDDRVAGPALDSIQSLLDGAMAGRNAEVAAARDRQVALTRTLIVGFPVVVGASFLGLGLGWRALLRDQERIRGMSADHEHRSLHDPLTGLANRHLFSQELAAALSGPDPAAAVLFLDLDDFKAINDGYGHDTGDQLLVAVAQRLTECVRGDLVARLGGDEFAVLVHVAGDPESIADRILAALRVPITMDGHGVIPSVSIGVAVAPSDGRAPRELLRSADRALYRAKAGGKGRWARAQPEDLDDQAPAPSARVPHPVLTPTT